MTEKLDDEDRSGNVDADLGLPNAERLKIKSGLVIEITNAIRSPGITPVDAGEHVRLLQANVSLILREQFGNVSARGLMDCLTRLGDDIELNARPAKKAVGQLLLRACDPATFCEK